MTEFILTQTEVLSSLKATLGATGIALLCGLIMMAVYRIGSKKPTAYMMISLMIIPVLVQVVIVVVNGSIGAGIAAAGAFSLVRFRSIPGSSRDISMLFCAMAAGLVSGMGYIGYALGITIVLAVVILGAEKIMSLRNMGNRRQLKIVVPEDMDFHGVFEEVLEEYTNTYHLDNIRTIRMGTMYEIVFTITMKKDSKVKEMLDKLRCRNGNLTISYGMLPDAGEEL
ncbi:MAG: DUF4956 domain-containing protein [Lachnospiraceae bacterium]|nr:DUF4956 domain-containing protein [Lachnospiraceae bacterium]